MFCFNFSKFNTAWRLIASKAEISIKGITSFLSSTQIAPTKNTESGCLIDLAFLDRSYSGDIIIENEAYEYTPSKVIYGFDNLGAITIGDHIKTLSSQTLSDVTCDSITFNGMNNLTEIQDNALYEVFSSYIKTPEGYIGLDNVPYIGYNAFSGLLNPDYDIKINRSEGSITIAGFSLTSKANNGQSRANISIVAPVDVIVQFGGFYQDPRTDLKISAGRDVVLGESSSLGLCADADSYGAFEAALLNTGSVVAKGSMFLNTRAFAVCPNIYNIEFNSDYSFHAVYDSFMLSHISSVGPGRVVESPVEPDGSQGEVTQTKDPYGISVTAEILDIQPFTLGNCYVKSIELTAETISLPDHCCCFSTTGSVANRETDYSRIEGVKTFYVPTHDSQSARVDTIDTLKQVKLTSTLGSISIGAFSFCGKTVLDTLTLEPDHVITRVGSHAFYNTSLPELSLSLNGDIEDYAFGTCKKLRTVSLTPADEKSTYTIGNLSFADCIVLRDLTIAPGATSIGEEAFINTAVPSVVIPNTVMTLGEGAFNYCEKLSSVVLSENLSILHECFKDSIIPSIDIPESIKELDSGCFIGISTLSHITGCEGVTKIGSSAFEGTGFVSADSVISLMPSASYGSEIFKKCPYMTSANIPAEFSTVTTSMFKDCPQFNVITVYDYSSDPLSIGINSVDRTKISAVHRQVNYDANTWDITYRPINFSAGWLHYVAPQVSVDAPIDTPQHIDKLFIYPQDSVGAKNSLGYSTINELHLRGFNGALQASFNQLAGFDYQQVMEWDEELECYVVVDIRKYNSKIYTLYYSGNTKPKGFPWGAEVNKLYLGEEYYSLQDPSDRTLSCSEQYVFDEFLNRPVLAAGRGDIIFGSNLGDEWTVSFWTDTDITQSYTSNELDEYVLLSPAGGADKGYIFGQSIIENELVLFAPCYTNARQGKLVHPCLELFANTFTPELAGATGNKWSNYIISNSPTEGLKVYLNGDLLTQSDSCSDAFRGSPVVRHSGGHSPRYADIHLLHRAATADDISRLSSEYSVSYLNLRSVLWIYDEYAANLYGGDVYIDLHQGYNTWSTWVNPPLCYMNMGDPFELYTNLSVEVEFVGDYANFCRAEPTGLRNQYRLSIDKTAIPNELLVDGAQIGLWIATYEDEKHPARCEIPIRLQY